MMLFPRCPVVGLWALVSVLAILRTPGEAGASEPVESASVYAGTTWGAWNDAKLWDGGLAPNGSGAVAEFSGDTDEFHFIVYLGGLEVTVGQLLRTGTRGQMFINPADVAPEIAGSVAFAGPEPLVECRTPLRIYAPVHGTDGLVKTGSGYLLLGYAGGTLQGDVVIRSGGVHFMVEDCAGDIMIRLEGDSWSGAGFGPGAYTWPVKLSGAKPYLAYTGPAGGESALSGDITGDDSVPLAVYSVGSRGRLVLSGNNTFAGALVIGRSDKDAPPTVLRAASSTALGAAGGSVFFAADGTKTHDEDALELSGGITVEGKTLTLRGRGAEAAGSLRSTDGDNTWGGDIDLGSLPAATIGVYGGTLVVQGAVSGENPAVALVKAGAGTLELRGEASHAGGTVIKGGTLVAANPRALAGRSVTVEAGEQAAALGIQGGQMVRVETLALQGGGGALHFSPVPSHEPMLAVAGKLQGAGTVNIEGDALAPGNYTLLVVGGGREGELTLGRMPAGSVGQLRWQGNNLVLEVKAS